MPVRARGPALPSFLVPVLTAAILLYRGLADLQVVLAHPEVQLVAIAVLGAGIALGLLAAFGGTVVRAVVLAVSMVGLLDMTLQPSRVFEYLEPTERWAAARDARRIRDLHALQAALERHALDVGPLPVPSDYGEGTDGSTFWPTWWDVSSVDEDGDGHFFLDFLAERQLKVPLDPVNSSPDAGDPRAGHQYIYFVVPRGYEYRGGVCESWRDKWVYMLGITSLETGAARQGTSACACLWADEPDFFAQHFDYLLCGTFDR